MASLHNLKSEFRYVTRFITLTREESIKHLKSQEKIRTTGQRSRYDGS